MAKDLMSVIKKDYESGYYTYKAEKLPTYAENYVFDENLTVKQNREMVKKANEKAQEAKKSARTKQSKLNKAFEDDCKDYLKDVYDFNDATAQRVYDYCYVEKHDIMSEFFWFLDEIGELVSDCLFKQNHLK